MSTPSEKDDLADRLEAILEDVDDVVHDIDQDARITRESLNGTADNYDEVKSLVGQLDDALNESFRGFESMRGYATALDDFGDDLAALHEDLEDLDAPPTATVTVSIGGAHWSFGLEGQETWSDESMAIMLLRGMEKGFGKYVETNRLTPLESTMTGCLLEANDLKRIVTFPANRTAPTSSHSNGG